MPLQLTNNSISIYKGELTTKEVINQGIKIKAAFPGLPQSFYDILWDRLKAHNFNDEKLKDAVDNLIDTCIYPLPTIANLVSFDKRVKLYTYNELGNLFHEGYTQDDFTRIKLKNKTFWVKKSEKEQYNILDEY